MGYNTVKQKPGNDNKIPNSNTKFAVKTMFGTDNVDWKYPYTS